MTRATRRRAQLAAEAVVKQQVRERDGYRCRICRRQMGSVHEVVPKSVGGVVSLTNSIALCGDGVNGCHGFAQRHEIDPAIKPVDANEPVVWVVKTVAALKWVGLPLQALPVLLQR